MRAYPMGTIAVILMASSGFITSVEAAQPPTGVWIDHTGRGAVEIKDCGDGNLCGHVVWLKDTNDAKGCGLQILYHVRTRRERAEGHGLAKEGQLRRLRKHAPHVVLVSVAHPG